MSVPSRSAALLSAALSTLAVSTAHAATTKITDGRLVDASSDGRLVLTTDQLINRETGAVDTFDPEMTPVDLADHSRRALLWYNEADGTQSLTRYNLDATSSATLWLDANIGPDNTKVPWGGHAKLVRDGQTIVFDTAEATPRIISFTPGEVGGKVLMTGATLLDASEDGQVITFRRVLPAVSRPAGTSVPATSQGSGARPAEPSPAATGIAVGYLVTGQAPRVVSRSAFTQTLEPLDDSGRCDRQFLRTRYTDPSALYISQDGANGQYTLYLGTRKSDNVYPDVPTTWTRLTAGDDVTLASNSYPKPFDRLWNDPVSGAYGIVQVGGTTANIGGGWWVGSDGVTTTPAAPSGSAATGVATVLPYGGGAHALFTALPLNPALATGTFDQDREPLGADATPWMSLPRSSDPQLTASTAIDANWASCTPAALPAGTAADYAAVTRLTAGNSAGSIAVHLAPSGKLAATKVAAQISWLGFPVWSTVAESDTTIKLPGLPLWIGGFTLTTTTTLTDGTALSARTSLVRWR